jgi:hypothetical protein
VSEVGGSDRIGFIDSDYDRKYVTTGAGFKISSSSYFAMEMDIDKMELLIGLKK